MTHKLDHSALSTVVNKKTLQILQQWVSQRFIVERISIVVTSFSQIKRQSSPQKRSRRPRVGIEEQRYSYTLSLTSALEGVVGQQHVSAALHRERDRHPLCRRLCGPPTGDRTADRPACRESLYRLHHSGTSSYLQIYSSDTKSNVLLPDYMSVAQRAMFVRTAC